MIARLRIWFQNASRHFEVVFFGIFLLASLALITLIVCAYLFDWEWTGFVPSFTEFTNRGITYMPGKSLWDWMALILAGIVAILVAYLTSAYSNRQKENELQTAFDKQREDAL